VSRAGDPPSRGIAFVISGPSGVGKSTLLRRALEIDPRLQFSVSHTTRPARGGERNGQDYWFVDDASFRRLIDEGAFLEWAEYQGHRYGTSRAAVEEPTARGVDLILEVEVQGARQLRDRLPDAVTVFVLPPASLADLETRLRERRSDDEPAIRKRLEAAEGELREARHYRYLIVNDLLDRALADLLHIVETARLECDRVLPVWRERFESA
jgi:guanylate kinase